MRRFYIKCIKKKPKDDLQYANIQTVLPALLNREATEELSPFEIKDSDVRTVPVRKHTLDLLSKLQAEAPEKVPYLPATKQR